MGQYTGRLRPAVRLLLVLACALMAGCEKPATPHPTTSPTTAPATAATPTLASIVPAATDMLLQMGAADHLVGISNFEPDIPELAGKARVGDYFGVDWEKLSQIRPNALILQRPKKDMVQAFTEQAASLKIQLVNVHMDRLEDIYPMIETVGAAAGEPAKAAALSQRLRDQLTRVTNRSANPEPVNTLIVLDKDAVFVVGPNNYLNDLLQMSGGKNVAADMGKDYPTIDLEKLLALDPEAIIQFLPQAQPQVLEAAEAFWKSHPNLKAVRNGRVYIHTDWYLQLPSARVGDVAEKMVNDLHPLTAVAPALKTDSR